MTQFWLLFIVEKTSTRNDQNADSFLYRSQLCMAINSSLLLFYNRYRTISFLIYFLAGGRKAWKKPFKNKNNKGGFLCSSISFSFIHKMIVLCFRSLSFHCGVVFLETHFHVFIIESKKECEKLDKVLTNITAPIFFPSLSYKLITDPMLTVGWLDNISLCLWLRVAFLAFFNL